MIPDDEFFLDPRVVRRAFDRAAASYDSAAGVQSEIRGRLLERLEVVRLQPRRVLDLGAGTAHASGALKKRYRSAQVIALDLSPAMLRQSSRLQTLLRRFQPVAGDAHRLPLKSASIDLVCSNLMLEWCHDPDAIFREIRRILTPHGLFMFATLGPDTLQELRTAWRPLDRHTHVHRFIDMHDLGDALMRANFADPVMDTERLTVTYPGMKALWRELKASGARNIAQGRPRGLTGRSLFETLQSQAALALRNGVLPVTLEVVYGQAWTAEPRPARRAQEEIRIPLQSLKGRVRQA